jgi:hypothetical protein
MKRATYEDVLNAPENKLAEILGTERIDRGRKLRIYAEAGVAHAWFVNPLERTLDVLRLREGAWTIVAVCSDSDAVRAPPFEAIELELGHLWVDPPRQP